MQVEGGLGGKKREGKVNPKVFFRTFERLDAF